MIIGGLATAIILACVAEVASQFHTPVVPIFMCARLSADSRACR
jgi:hypothetical protein